MTRRVTRTHQADEDVVSLAVYFASEAGWPTGERFLDALRAAITRLADFPEIGTAIPRADDVPLRCWRITRFPRVLILYSVRDGSLLIERVIDGAQLIDREDPRMP